MLAEIVYCNGFAACGQQTEMLVFVAIATALAGVAVWLLVPR